MAEPPDWEWWYGATKDAHLPLSILQLDPADRAVLRIAGKYTAIVSIVTPVLTVFTRGNLKEAVL